jgi:hypothetical protein
MADKLYLVDPASKQLTSINPISLSDLGIGERKDLEAWVTANPEVLGEELLVVTSEFNRFDRSDRRLDVLALDKKGALVIIELKLDLSRSFADQQAIRYAAFCSTMTMEQVAEELAIFKGCPQEEARSTILDFLQTDELPELDDKPRIILAAGSLDDEELVSTVLWLRSFGVDITCIEMTPYHLANDDQIALVPRTIIPLPEAKNYVVRVEKKQISKVERSQEAKLDIELWQVVAASFNALNIPFKVTPRKASFMPVPIGHGEIHYEWLRRRRDPYLSVALHLESRDREINQSRLKPIADHKNEIATGVGYTFIAEMWGKNWATAEFRVPYDPVNPMDVAPEAVRVMQLLIERTWPIIEPIVKGIG